MKRSLTRFLIPRLVVLAVLAAGSIASAAPPFFAMDTCVSRMEPAIALPLIKQSGFDGYGDNEKTVLSNLALLNRERLRLVNVYFVVSFDASQPLLTEAFRAQLDRLAENGPVSLWIAIGKVNGPAGALRASDAAGDELALEKLKELNAYAEPRSLRVSLYPHSGYWLERVDDAARIAKAIGSPNVGITFNLCHWLKAEGERDPAPILRETLPILNFVTINGADGGDTRAMDWKRLIQPLGEGTYDVGAFLGLLQTTGYRGPIGLQGYGIPGDPAEDLIKSFSSWKRLSGIFSD